MAEFMFPNGAYRGTVYGTGLISKGLSIYLKNFASQIYRTVQANYGFLNSPKKRTEITILSIFFAQDSDHNLLSKLTDLYFAKYFDSGLLPISYPQLVVLGVGLCDFIVPFIVIDCIKNISKNILIAFF